MSAGSIAAAVLLSTGVAAMLLSCLGLVLLRDVYDRLHCVGFATLTGTFFVAAALFVGKGLASLPVKAALVFLFAAAIGAVLTHAAGRSFRLREERHEDT